MHNWYKVPDIAPDPGNKYIAISAGWFDVPLLAIREDGSLVVFHEELVGNDAMRRTIVNPETPENPFVDVDACGGRMGWVLRKDGSLFRIPRRRRNDDGGGDVLLLESKGTFVALSAGSSCSPTCALFKGEHSFAILGENHPKTVFVHHPSPIVSLGSGTAHWIALHADGVISYNDVQTEQQNTTVDADPTDPFVAIAAGQSVSIALKKSGSVRVFGEWGEAVRTQFQW